MDRPVETVPPLALTVDEAAASLGVSKAYFDEHIRHELRIVRRGRRILIGIDELRRWVERNSARACEEWR